MKKFIYLFCLVSLLKGVDNPLFAMEKDHLNFKCMTKSGPKKECHLTNLESQNPQTLEMITETLKKHGINSIEEVGMETAIKMFLTFYEIDHEEEIEEEKRSSILKTKKVKKKKKKTSNKPIPLSNQIIPIDIEEKRKKEIHWENETLKKIKEEAERYVKEEGDNLYLLSLKSNTHQPIINLPPLRLGVETQATTFPQSNFSIENLVMEKQERSVISNEIADNQMVFSPSPLAANSQISDLANSIPKKSKAKTKKKGRSKASSLKNSNATLSVSQSSVNPPLKYGEVTLLARPKTAIPKQVNPLKTDHDFDQTTSLDCYQPLYVQPTLSEAPAYVPPYYGSRYFPVSPYPYFMPFYQVMEPVYYYPSPLPYSTPLENVIIHNQLQGTDCRVKFYNETERRYEGIEPGLFIPESNPALEEIKTLLSKHSDTN